MEDDNQIFNIIFLILIGVVIGFYIGMSYHKNNIYNGGDNNFNEVFEEINRMTQSPLLP